MLVVKPAIVAVLADEQLFAPCDPPPTETVMLGTPAKVWYVGSTAM